MVATVEVRGNFDRQDGSNAVAGTLYVTLTKRDYDGATVIEPIQQEVELDADGSFAGVQLWPNDRGRTNSAYRVEYLPGGGQKRETIAAELFVPEAGAPHDLADLIMLSDVARASQLPRIVPISAADFVARQSAGTLSDALYLVDGVLA